MGTGRLVRTGSTLVLVLAVAGCSGSAAQTPTQTPATGPTASPTPSSTPTPSATVAPTPTPTAKPSPRPMAQVTLTPGPKMPQVRAGQAAVRLADGRVLMMGGSTLFTGKCEMMCMNPTTASVEIYDPDTGKFSPFGSLTVPRTDGHALLLNDGRVLIVGGTGDWGGYLNTIEIFDPTRQVSVAVKPPADTQKLPADPTAVLLADGRVLLAAGSYDDAYTPSDATLVLDPASGAFSTGPVMAEARFGAGAVLLTDGRVLIVGGNDSFGYFTYPNKYAEIIDPSHPLAQSTMTLEEHPATSTLLSDGRVLVTEFESGEAQCSPVPTVAEIFDPGSVCFAPASPMNVPRSGSAVIATKDGRVLFIGGLDAKCATTSTIEAFDPDSGTFQLVGTGFPDIRGFSMTLLDDGDILIAGAYGDFGNPPGMTAATWILKP